MSTMAEDAYRNREPLNLQRHSDHLRERLAAIGALDGADTTHPRYPAMFDSPLREGLARVADEVAGALVDLGYDPARVAILTVGATADDGSLARYESFEDESGLVAISDSLITLCNAYCEYAGRALARTMSGGLLRMAGRILLTRWTGAIGEDPRLLAGILRYHNVTRRAYGIAGILNFTAGPEADMALAMRDVVMEFGLRFIVSHEAAHHVFGHNASSDPPTEQREMDADTLALFTAAEAFARYQAEEMGWLPQRWRQEAAEFHGLLGALVTMLALHTSENALFIRRGRTHPLAEVRSEQLINHVLSPERQERLNRMLGRRDPRMTMRFEKDRGSLGVYLRNLAIATQLATDFNEGATAFDWAAFAASSKIEKPLTGHLDNIAVLDRIMCGPEAALAEEVKGRLDPEGARLALAGDTVKGLLTWGVRPARVRAVHDQSCALAFHALVEEISRTLPPGTDTVRACVAAATLIERTIARQQHGDVN